jgi:hypothetical protein
LNSKKKFFYRGFFTLVARQASVAHIPSAQIEQEGCTLWVKDGCVGTDETGDIYIGVLGLRIYYPRTMVKWILDSRSKAIFSNV